MMNSQGLKKWFDLLSSYYRRGFNNVVLGLEGCILVVIKEEKELLLSIEISIAQPLSKS